MVIIGISGKKCSGKTTLAKVIAELKSDTVIINFADALKEEVAEACKVTVEHIESNKKDFRTILQWYGTDFRRKQDNEYWLKRWMNKCLKTIPEPKLVIAADVRFKNEADLIKQIGGIVIRVNRVSTVVDNHPSETELDDYPFDLVISNNGTLDELRTIAATKIIKRK